MLVTPPTSRQRSRKEDRLTRTTAHHPRTGPMSDGVAFHKMTAFLDAGDKGGEIGEALLKDDHAVTKWAFYVSDHERKVHDEIGDAQVHEGMVFGTESTRILKMT